MQLIKVLFGVLCGTMRDYAGLTTLNNGTPARGSLTLNQCSDNSDNNMNGVS